MTKAELVAKVAGEGGITKSQAEKAVDGFVSAVSRRSGDGRQNYPGRLRDFQHRRKGSA